MAASLEYGCVICEIASLGLRVCPDGKGDVEISRGYRTEKA
jgi:hypothetical protein